MQVPGWLVFLGIELIVILLIAMVVLLIIWKRTCSKQKQHVSKLLDELHHQKNAYESLKHQQQNVAEPETKLETGPEQETAKLEACREELELLKIQLQQARENPFLQEKIDALTAENEDLQSQLEAYRG